jgi:hypothetical protein
VLRWRWSLTFGGHLRYKFLLYNNQNYKCLSWDLTFTMSQSVILSSTMFLSPSSLSSLFPLLPSLFFP